MKIDPSYLSLVQNVSNNESIKTDTTFNKNLQVNALLKLENDLNNIIQRAKTLGQYKNLYKESLKIFL